MDNYYDTALNELNEYIDKDLSSYSKDRNYDFGPQNRKNVSMLSKYISHRVLNEYDVVKKVLEKHKFNKVEKFIQEVFWRVYWKGWLEHRPDVWHDYVRYDNSNVNKDDLEKAYSGCTDIDCFNDWVSELKTTNYLHNHTRMWFASIWIFTLKLPWQLGANFFLHHLYDGDSASNTLSWRWVAGLQTIGKNYLATSANIAKYTSGRLRPNNLIEDAEPIPVQKTYDINEIYFSNHKSDNNTLLIFDDNLDYQFINDIKNNYGKLYFIFLSNDHRSISLSENVISFKRSIIDDISSKFEGSVILDGHECISLLNSKSIDIIYPNIGDNLTYINSHSKTGDINFIYHEHDLTCWQFSKKGFFNFKKNIPDIIKKINNTKDLFA